MKFSIKKSILLENLNIVSKAMSSKNLIPILGGIKFTLDKKGLSLIATDNNIAIETKIVDNKIELIEKEGTIVLPGKYIVDIIRKIPSEIVKIQLVDEYLVKIDYDQGEFNINAMDANEFPQLDLKETKKAITLKTDDFKNIINETAFAISTSETRPILTGINFRITNNILSCFSTDSYRLAKKTLEIDGKIDDINIVIPGKNLTDFRNIIKENVKTLEMHIFENKVLLIHDNVLFQTRLLAGTFPEVTKLIPANFEVETKVKVQDIYNAIDRASLLSTERDKVVVNLTLANNSIIIRSNTPELGKVEEVITIENETNFAISFVAKYMLEALKSFSTNEVKISFNAEDKPFILESTTNKDLVQLVLPIKTY